MPIVIIDCQGALPTSLLITEESDKQFVSKTGRKPGLEIRCASCRAFQSGPLAGAAPAAHSFCHQM